MLENNNPTVVVPPVPTPRKNKFKIYKNFTIWDMLIIVLFLLAGLVIMFTTTLPTWAAILILIVLLGFGAFLVWPMGFLGKEKIWVTTFKMLKFVFMTDKNLVTEENVIENKPEEPQPKKEYDKPKFDESKQKPKDILSRVFNKEKPKKEEFKE